MGETGDIRTARDVDERSLAKAEAAGGGAEGQPLQGSLTDDHRLARSRGRGDVRLPLLSSTRVGGPSKRVGIPNREDRVVVGMRQLLMRIDSDG
jgi:hypothetical protein